MGAEMDIAARLEASAGLEALVDDRIYAGRAPQNAQPPFVVWRRVAAMQEAALDGVVGIQTGRFQFDCFAAHYDQMVALAEALNAALTAAQGAVLFVQKVGEVDAFDDDEPKLWRRIVDYRTKETMNGW